MARAPEGEDRLVWHEQGEASEVGILVCVLGYAPQKTAICDEGPSEQGGETQDQGESSQRVSILNRKEMRSLNPPTCLITYLFLSCTEVPVLW